jgi:hypothetical protein
MLSNCQGQSGDKNKSQSADKPETNFKVNKVYDKNGNLVRYDSTYSSYYSNVKGNKNMRDSIFNDFKINFNKRFSFSNEPYFNKFFFEDSVINSDFYNKDFFLKRFRDDMNRMDSLFGSMDVFKNDYFNRQFKGPGGLKVPKK